jgi:hypothetical protein
LSTSRQSEEVASGYTRPHSIMRHFLGTLAVVTLGLGLAPAALHADEYVDIGTRERAGLADLIVVGALVPDSRTGDAAIRVTERVMGQCGPTVRVWDTLSYCSGFRDGAIGIFFLRKGREEPDPPTYSAAACFSVERLRLLPYVRALAAMLRDPAPFVRAEDPWVIDDLIWAVGHVFGRYELTCRESPALSRLFGRGGDGDYSEAPQLLPWTAHGVYNVEFVLDLTQPPTVTPRPGTDAIADYLRARLEVALKREPDGDFPRLTTLVLDADAPHRVGGLKREEALAFLRKHLNAPESNVQAQSLYALSRMRDRGSATRAVELLRSTQSEVRRAAAVFLGRAREAEAVAALCSALHASLERGGAQSYESQAYIAALKSIGRPGTAQLLLPAILAGFAGSGETVSQLCAEDCVPDLLGLVRHAENDASRKEAHEALERLVWRSTVPHEAWMGHAATSAEGESLADRWDSWWGEHSAHFHLRSE